MDAAVLPVKVEVVTSDGEGFVLAMTRMAWTKLILTGQEVEGWMEPIEVDPDFKAAS
jgi:hypothetical protein